MTTSSVNSLKKRLISQILAFQVLLLMALVAGFMALLTRADLGGKFLDADAASVAAGAILAMLADTMIPEAFEVAHNFAGLITVAGFLAAFCLSKLGG